MTDPQIRDTVIFYTYLGSGEQLSNKSQRLQVALSQQQPPLFHGDLHLELLLLLFLLSPHFLEVLPLFFFPQPLLSSSYFLFLPPFLLLLFLLLLLPKAKLDGMEVLALTLHVHIRA